jgi:hypothetical protein
MSDEQSRLLLLRLRDVGLSASWLSTILGPMTKLAAFVARVVSCRLLLPSGAALGITLGTSSHPCLGVFARLATLVAAYRGRRLPLLVTLAGNPLLPSEEELLANGDGSREALWLIAVNDIEATQRFLDRYRGEVQQRLD